MGDLPSGTVTFLFSDIEGSTRLLQELGERYADVLGDHRRVLRAAFEAHHGVEVDTQGDAFFVAFPRAADAVAAAIDAQRALSAGPVRARMGLHTGEPLLREGGYVGLDVHRGARICAAGHGGQVLLSAATSRALDGAIELRDLGEHRLKDLPMPEWLFQLVGIGLETGFPPLRTLNNTNLPAWSTSLIGRTRELAELSAMLARRDVRLITLTGPGGTGKTRLALSFAAGLVESFKNGVFLVELASVAVPDRVVPTIARTLGARESGAETALEALRRHLETRSTLLLLDNFEQVLAAASEIARLLEAASGLRILVTSRERLRLAGEREYAVQPLVEGEAVDLFDDRARAALPAFAPEAERPHVAAICRRLDGLPLAIELAAARMKVLSPRAVLARLDQRLPMLTGGARDLPERQRTLRATIDWSHELLDPAEREAFARLSIFVRSWTAEAAEAVCSVTIEQLSSLLDKSLLRRLDADGRSRFWMLETIREYALERLQEAGLADELRRRHAAHYREIAVAAKTERDGVFAAAAYASEGIDPHVPGKPFSEEDVLNILGADRDELVAALSTLVDAGDAKSAVELVLSLWRLWLVRGPLRDGREWTERVLGVPGVQGLPEYAWLLTIAAEFPRFQGDPARACALLEEAIPRLRESGDRAHLAAAIEALAIAVGDERDFQRSRSLHRESLALARELGDRSRIGHALNGLTVLAFREGDYAGMASAADAELAHARVTGDVLYQISGLTNVAEAQRHLGELHVAASSYGEALELCDRLGALADLAECVDGIADVAAERGDLRTSVRLWAASGRMLEDGGFEPWDRHGQEDGIAMARGLLGPAAFESTWREGRALSVADAVAEASAAARMLAAVVAE